MSKRFTETTKWENLWFRTLTPKNKCLWSYLADRCDQAGVIEADYAAMSFHIGATITARDVAALGENVRTLPNGKLWLPKFVRFQYGSLSHDCKPHSPVFAALENHGLTEADVLAPERVSTAPVAPAASPSPLLAFTVEAPKADTANIIEAIWKAYPRKEKKSTGVTAIKNALKRTTPEILLAAVIAYATATALWPVDDRRFIPHPASWFNGDRFLDDPAMWVREDKGNAKVGMKGASYANGF